MKTKFRLSNPLHTPLRTGVAAAALITVPVAAMLLTDAQQVTPPPPQSVTNAALDGAAETQAEQRVPARPAVPAAYVVTQWERLLNPRADITLSELTRFLDDYPGFPNTTELKQRAERMMELHTPVRERLAYFQAAEPLSARARFLHADALLRAGNRPAAIEQAREAWRSAGLQGEDRYAFLQVFGSDMRPVDHAERVDAQLWRHDISAASGMLSLLSSEDKALAEARIALQRGAQRGGDQTASRAALLNVEDSLRRHPGLIADQYAYARATGNSAYARQLLADTRIAPGSAGDRNAWMEAHLSAAEGALNDRQYELAYRIAAHHGGLPFSEPLIENSAKERDTFTSLEWLAGWTALHHLNRPEEAIRHFENFRSAAKFAHTRSRGLFWAGRAADAARRADAATYYARAAEFPLTFYGQLAHERLNRPLGIQANDIPAPSPQTLARWNADPRVEAVRIYGRQGDTGKQRMFLEALAEDADRETLPLVAALANSTGNERIAVQSTRGMDTTGPDAIVALSYPRLEVPAETRAQWVRIHALTRQESQFETDAVSHAGARGLMQLMPATARDTSGKAGLSYSFGGLTSDPDYNIRLGSTYFANMVDNWNGSYVLAIASYNAGPGNVRRWVREHGDPRDPNVDVLKWIEEIPFYETKTYVRNVLGNIIVYEQLAPEYRRGGPEQARLNWYLEQGQRG